MVPQLARKTIGEARVTPHPAAHGPILSLDVAGLGVLGVRGAGDVANVNSDALGGRVARFIFKGLAVDFLLYRVIHIRAKSPLYRFSVRLVAVLGDLSPVTQAASQIVNKVPCDVGFAVSKSPARNQLGMGIDGTPKPDVARIGVILGNFFRAVLFFAVNPGPNLVKLQTAASEIPEHIILVVGAHVANFYEQAHRGFLRDAGHSDGGPDRASFDQAVNHLCSRVA
jgi:hypothetical protein